MLENYNDIVEAVGDWLARDDLSDRIPDFIRLAEVDAQRELDLREIEKEGTLTTVADTTTVTLPSDFIKARAIQVGDSPTTRLDVVSMANLISIRAANANKQPFAAAVVGDKLELAPTPNAAYTLTLWYSGKMTPLSFSNQTNELISRSPDLLLYGALMHSAPFLGDDARVQMWRSFYNSARVSTKREEFMSKSGHGPLQVRPDSAPGSRGRHDR